MSTDRTESGFCEERPAQLHGILEMAKRAVTRSRALRGVADVNAPESPGEESRSKSKPKV